jgi:hypothetical protein
VTVKVICTQAKVNKLSVTHVNITRTNSDFLVKVVLKYTCQYSQMYIYLLSADLSWSPYEGRNSPKCQDVDSTRYVDSRVDKKENISRGN